ncbi:MAG TPA: hypothetical protein VFV63_10010 [Ilumatobacteraceae bacterium]|nr:hypothetical protein [Ilumatobacteraceae bacterium]
MVRCLRRFIWLVLIGGAAAAAYTVWHRRQVERPAPEWSPPDPAPLRLVGDEPRPTTSNAPAGEDADDASPASTWVPPVDGACPPGYPIKGNANSRIYHVPGGRFYDRTVPERCYASTAGAEADGYRAAKS